MMRNSAGKIAALDQRYVWHPFTQMKDWMEREPVVIVRGKGACLWDARGNKYLDANSSIWTNLHGHSNPTINRAIQRQLKKIAHSSALGLANEPAAKLAERLVKAAALPRSTPDSTPKLKKVFYSDDGSTAVEVAVKLSYEYWRRHGVKSPRFLTLQGAYHGDTVGAVSLGHIDLFHKAYGGLLFETETVMAPYCYRCPFNRAKPERADARDYRKCNWECVGEVEKKFSEANRAGRRITAFSVEPSIQGAAGFIPQPEGWLERVAQITRSWRAHLIADEVMTGFGRTNLPANERSGTSPLFATQQMGVVPDFLAVAKGLTGGYLPLAATLTTQEVFDAFLGNYEEFKTFFHGHSYSGNQLGCAAALASLDLLESRESKTERRLLGDSMRSMLQTLWEDPHVGDIRQVGLVAGIELVRDWRTREPFNLTERVGIRVCEALACRGVLTRPVGNVIVLMPPYCTTQRQLRKIIESMQEAIREITSVSV